MMSAWRRGALIVAGMAILGGSACHRAAPAAPAAEAPLGELQVLKDGRFLFTYVERSGTFSTTDKPDSIPEVARKVVRVADPTQLRAGETSSVHVCDVEDLLKAGKAAAHTMSREAFETAALLQLPAGATSARAGHPVAAAGAAQAAPPIKSPPGTPVVTIYGTSWCGACRAAREYFAAKKIPFADKDVEQDPAAAQELADKAAKLGIPTDRVPIIDVRGRLLLGFDKARVEALLGAST